MYVFYLHYGAIRLTLPPPTCSMWGGGLPYPSYDPLLKRLIAADASRGNRAFHIG